MLERNCRVHKPGVPHGQAFQQRLGPADNVASNEQLMGRPKYLNDRSEGRSNHRPEGLAKEEPPASESSPPLRPERSLRSLAHLRTASPTGRPGQSTTSDSNPTSSTEVRKNLAHYSSLTSAIRIDWDQPTKDARSKGTGEQTGKAR